MDTASLVVVIVGVISSIVCYRYGLRIGLSRPAAQATRRLREVEDQIETKYSRLQHLDQQLDRFSPLAVRIGQVKRQERKISEIEAQIAGAHQQIGQLTESIRSKELEAAAYPAIARYNHLDNQISALLNQQLAVGHQITELMMDLTNAQGRLIELVDALAAKRQELTSQPL
jgi:peptidoglycan hydrolase CwlO-like protein